MVLRVVSLSLLLAGSAAAPPTPATSSIGNRLLEAAPGEVVQYSVGDRTVIARVTPEGMTSGDVTLRRFRERLSGSVGVDPIEVRLEPTRLDGHIGNDPIGLDVVRSGDSLQIMGRFGFRSVALQVEPSTIYGQVGPCWYKLTLQAGSYVGQVKCGGQPRPVRLTVPASLVARPDTEVAAMLTALLSR